MSKKISTEEMMSLQEFYLPRSSIQPKVDAMREIFISEAIQEVKTEASTEIKDGIKEESIEPALTPHQ